MVQLGEFGADAFGENAQGAGLFEGIDRLGIFAENFVRLSEGVEGGSVGGVDENGLFQFDGGVAVVAVFEEFVPGSVMFDGCGILGPDGECGGQEQQG